MKFKNLRRPGRAYKAGIVVPPSKKPKVTAEQSASDLAEYEQHISQIKKSYSSHKWSVGNLATLLELTSILCRQWINEESPTVKEVLEKFPCLSEPKLVSI